MKNIWLTSVCLLILASFSGAGESEENAERLAEVIPGAYSTSFQAAEDSYFLDLQLHIVQFKPQFESDSNSYWLYLETAFTSDSLRPYKQQVFSLTPYQLGLVKLVEYSIINKGNFINAWQNPALLNTLEKDSLVLKPNCAIVLKKIDDIFVGSTTGEGCLSTLRGAAFETTEMEITQKEFYLWNRGFNRNKEQVWGTQKSGYSFLKKK